LSRYTYFFYLFCLAAPLLFSIGIWRYYNKPNDNRNLYNIKLAELRAALYVKCLKSNAMVESFHRYSKVSERYCQIWVNDHLRIATTCLQRPPFRGPIFNFYINKTTSEQWPPVNKDHKFCVPKVVVVNRFYCTRNEMNLRKSR